MEKNGNKQRIRNEKLRKNHRKRLLWSVGEIIRNRLQLFCFQDEQQRKAQTETISNLEILPDKNPAKMDDGYEDFGPGAAAR